MARKPYLRAHRNEDAQNGLRGWREAGSPWISYPFQYRLNYRGQVLLAVPRPSSRLTRRLVEGT